MMRSPTAFLFALAITTHLMAALDPKMNDPARPPVAEQRPHRSTHHGITLEDPWHWLRDESYPTVDDKDVLAYLKAENR